MSINYATVNKIKMEGKKMIITGNSSAKAVLTAAGKNTFRYIREIAGIDFTRPVIINQIDGKFTINQIWKTLPHVNYDYSVCVILSRNMETKYPDSWMNRYYIVKLTYGGTANDFVTEIRSETYFDSHTKPDDIYRKTDFNDIRKTETVKAFVIAQKKEYNVPIKIRKKYGSENYKIKENERYTAIKPSYTYYGHEPCYTKIITRFDLKERDGNRQKPHYANVPFIPGNSEYGNIETFFDKSGYYVQGKRDSLKRRAKALRDERAKALYLETDTSNKATDAKIAVTKAKTYIIGLLAATNDYKTVSKIAHILDFDFKWIVFDLELFEKRTANKEYSSIESSEKAYNNIMQKIEKLYSKLAEKEQEETT